MPIGIVSFARVYTSTTLLMVVLSVMEYIIPSMSTPAQATLVWVPTATSGQ